MAQIILARANCNFGGSGEKKRSRARQPVPPTLKPDPRANSIDIVRSGLETKICQYKTGVGQIFEFYANIKT